MVLGNIIDYDGKQIYVDVDGVFSVVKLGFFNVVISYCFLIFYCDEYGVIYDIGVWIVYFSCQVVICKVVYGFMLIFINLVIKMLVLWFIFFYVFYCWFGWFIIWLLDFVCGQDLNQFDYFDNL